ncbi:wd repeat-containing protein [Moniliophthora roreri]|nr:wd repeat-containing protein [Moniliophthora roreri]
MSSATSSHSIFTESVPSWTKTTRYYKGVLSATFRENVLDRVNVLGDDREYGHAGCVNALHWAREGELLLSSGDDTTVQIWRMDPADTSQDYPFTCKTVIHTGHRANIFNVHLLPYSSRIATVAGDRQVRVFDVGEDVGMGDRMQEFHTGHALTHTFRCHEDRVKRIVTENSPDVFLTVSEDGSVRQHDLRTPHSCRTSTCPPPILQVEHELSTLALSPLTPYQMVVAGSSPFGYLFDRRYTARESWMKPNGVTTCVRRFGRPPNVPRDDERNLFHREHITGARMATENGHEVLLSYSGDGVYLYSTMDEPEDEKPRQGSVLPSNSKATSKRRSPPVGEEGTEDEDTEMIVSENKDNDDKEEEEEEEDDDDDEDYEDEDQYNPRTSEAFHPWVPVILPRMRYAGARNIDTVKDVNFLGPSDEYVVSGSDDGNWFMWNKSDGELHGIYEGDGSVVNVIEAHPYLPLVAVSGIDKTVKLFGPARGESQFSRTSQADSITRNNQDRNNLRIFRTIRRSDFITLLASMHAAQAIGRGGDSDDDGEGVGTECINQ